MWFAVHLGSSMCSDWLPHLPNEMEKTISVTDDINSVEFYGGEASVNSDVAGTNDDVVHVSG
jgi:hypothetical protein